MHKIIGLLVTSLLAIGCSIPQYIEVVEEDAKDVEAVKAGAPVQVLPLQWDFSPPEDWDAEEDWDRLVVAWNAHYVEYLKNGVQYYDGYEWRSPTKDYIHLEPGQKPGPEGIVVASTIYNMRRDYGYFGKAPDHIFTTVVITDAASGKELYRAKFDSWNAKNTGTFETWSFGGRIRYAVRSLAWEGIALVAHNGRMPVPEDQKKEEEKEE